MDHALASAGLTTPQYAVLAALERAPGLSNADLARVSFVTPQTMMRILAGLEEKGLVQRTEHPSHGRILEATLTPRGTRVVEASHQLVLRVEHKMLSPLAGAERVSLASFLDRCANALGGDERR